MLQYSTIISKVFWLSDYQRYLIEEDGAVTLTLPFKIVQQGFIAFTKNNKY